MASNAELHLLDRNVRYFFTQLQTLFLPAHDRHVISPSLVRLVNKDNFYKELWVNIMLDSLLVGTAILNGPNIIPMKCTYKGNVTTLMHKETPH